MFRLNDRTREPVIDPVTKVMETGAIAGLANHSVLLARDGREIPIDDSAAMPRSTLLISVHAVAWALD